jgi:putative integral membrane protein (TIGR02587 family)
MTDHAASTASEDDAQSSARTTAVSYARGAAGGLIIALPLLYTMEMWWGGFVIPPGRLLLLFVLNFGVLLVLQHFSGLHPRKTPAGQVRAAFGAYGIGVIVSAAVLLALDVLRRDSELHDVIGKLVLEAVAVSIGASVAMSEFGAESDVTKRRKDERGYWDAMGMALAGAMLFGFSLGVTDEPTMIGLELTWLHAAVLVIWSIIQVHVIVYAVEFKERERSSEGPRWWQRLLKEAVSAYALSLLVSAYLLWTFGRIGGDTGFAVSVHIVISLGFATSLGAAAGELLL